MTIILSRRTVSPLFIDDTLSSRYIFMLFVGSVCVCVVILNRVFEASSEKEAL